MKPNWNPRKEAKKLLTTFAGQLTSLRGYIFALLIFWLGPVLRAQDISVYRVVPYELDSSHTIAFISLSDTYIMSENPDSAVIMDISGRPMDSIRYLRLDSVYRQRFLRGTKLTEADMVYIYDYSSDKLVSIPVRKLPVVACLNIYASAEETFSQQDFMIGFEVPRRMLHGMGAYYQTVLVAIRRDNPFVSGWMKPVKWVRADTIYPDRPMPRADSLYLAGYGPYTVGARYWSESVGYQYYAREYLLKDEVIARHVWVTKNKETVYDRIYYHTEGTSPAPLTMANGDNGKEQWAGLLFKNKPPVIFGFNYVSFGCPSISFLNKDVNDIDINCDNRH